MQQEPRDFPTLEGEDVQDQEQEEPLVSRENDLSLEQGSLSQKKKRGIVMSHVHARKDRKVIVLNRYNQPVGPTATVVAELGSFLGTSTRNAMLCPLHIHKWSNVDTKKDLWEYTLEKYKISEAGKLWVLKRIQSARRKYKNYLYRKHYIPFATDALRLANKPDEVSDYDFKDLLKYWASDEFKNMSETNAKNRKKRIRILLKKEKGTSGEVSQKELFVVTRSSKPDRVYKDTDEDTIAKIVEMEKNQSQQSEEGQESIDAFTTVMGPEHLEFVRLYGRGVSKTTLKQKKIGESSVADTNEMQKKMDELEDRMVEKLELQKRSIRHEVIVDILKRLNRMYPGIQLDADVLVSHCAQPQQEDIQSINRPSASSNNAGGENNLGGDESMDEDDI